MPSEPLDEEYDPVIVGVLIESASGAKIDPPPATPPSLKPDELETLFRIWGLIK